MGRVEALGAVAERKRSRSPFYPSVVFVVLKERQPQQRPSEVVIGVTAGSGAGMTRHGEIVSTASRAVKKTVRVPFFPFRVSRCVPTTACRPPTGGVQDRRNRRERSGHDEAWGEWKHWEPWRKENGPGPLFTLR